MDEATVHVQTLRAMQSLAREVWGRRPELVSAEATLGELAWLWGAGHRRADGWQAKVWSEGGATLAYGWAFAPQETIVSKSERRTEPATLVWQTHLDRPELLDEVLAWFASVVPGAEASGTERQTAAREVDVDAIATLLRHGYVRDDPGAPWGMLNVRELDEIEEPVLPEGYRFVTMREIDDVERRAEAHRVAWAPSSVTAETYADAMATWPYRDDLDFAIESDDGTLVASAIGWYDDANDVAEFEPVGTHPGYRQRGLGRALLLFGMQRFREAGARQAVVGCRGDNNYPIPKKLYSSVGFRELTREIRFVTP